MDITTVADIVRAHAAAAPDRPMLTYEDRVWTYGDMDRRSNQVAQALAAAGVGPGDRVAFLDKNTPEFFEVSFGAAKLDAVVVAINWRLAAREVAQILDDAHPKVLFVGGEFVPTIEKVEGDVRVPLTVVVGAHATWAQYDKWTASRSTDDPGVHSTHNSAAFQFYTSGTTGTPKGVILTNDNAFALIRGASPLWGLTPTTVNLGVMPLFHVSGSGWNMAAMANGGHTILHREVVPAAILRDVARYGITHSLWVPAVIQLLLDTPGVESADFSSLRTVLYGASPISDDVLVRAMDTFGCQFIQAYGLTETFGAVTILAGPEHDPARPELLRSCGRPMPGVELRIVDPDTTEDKPEGAVGEVWIHSRQVMLGYWRKASATALAKTPDGWLRTGDAGYMRDGYLYLYDRVKDMIVSGGENVYPAEVENVLMGHPAVADVAVIGVPDARWGETVKAVVVVHNGNRADATGLVSYARENLAHYKCPTSIDFVDALPRNASGKLLKRELREPYWTGERRRIGG
jgi:long-chain acyl-CoA synthetase